MRVRDRFFVYIMTNRPRGVLYVGMTNDLERRVGEHKTKWIPGFTANYNITKLVHFEEFGDPTDALAREHGLKRWRRAWKIELIESGNPDWRDLAAEWWSDLT